MTTAVARRSWHVKVTVVEPLFSAVTSVAAVNCTAPRTTTSTDSGTILTAATG